MGNLQLQIEPLPSSIPFYALSANKEKLLRAMLHSASSSRPLVKVGSIPLLKRDLQILMGNGWLNDELVNGYCALLARHSPHTYFFSTFFYTKLVDAGFAGVARWTRKRSPLGGGYKRLVFPLNFGNAHWALAYADLERREIGYLDSMGSARQGRVTARLKAYLGSESQDKGLTERWSEGDIAALREFAPRHVPQQQDGESCGVFACLFARELAREHHIFADSDAKRRNGEDNWGQNEASQFRKRMAWDLLAANQGV